MTLALRKSGYRLARFVGAGAIALATTVASTAYPATFNAAALSTNEFGLDLYRKVAASDKNLCLSPYSISCALSMTLVGADGETRPEMARVLHLNPDSDFDASFAVLQKSLEAMVAQTAKIAENSKKTGGPSEPITISVANRLFPQSGYQFRDAFFARLKEQYGAAPEPLDFKKNGAGATKRINDWVEKQTRGKIRDLIPRPLDAMVRLVLANAIYLKAPWSSEFSNGMTKPEGFHINGGNPVDVPTMHGVKQMRYAKEAGSTIVALPYSGGDLQLVILVPDKLDGLRSIEQNLSADLITRCTKLTSTEVDLHLPKFKLEPPTIQLNEQLQALGMKTAFDIPEGSANFDRIAPRKPDDYLAISDVFHKTFIAVDEKGTEAAAATAVVVSRVTSIARPPSEPVEVRVDRPFVYAIQHVPSSACLFLGRVTDPR